MGLPSRDLSPAFPKPAKTLFRKSFALWEKARQVFREANAAHHIYASKTVEGITLIARLYLREADRWQAFLTEIGVTRPRRGPISNSQFHGIAKRVLEVDSDDDGRASRLAAILDQWHAQRDRIAPDQIPDWIAGQGGLTRLYKNSIEVVGHRGVEDGWSWRGWPKQGHAVAHALRIDFTNTSTEWYTPPRVFEAMAVKFDQDVASPGAAIVPWIPAKQHYTKLDDGLKMRWRGFIWLNPEWGLRNSIMDWIEKFITHGNGVALLPDWTSTEWWHTIGAHSEFALFVRPKLQFLPNRGTTNTLGTTLFSIGPTGARALQNAECNGLGLCFKRP